MITTVIIASVVMDNLAIIAMIFSGVVALFQWLNTLKRKAEKGERQVAMTKLREEILIEVEKELKPIQAELLALRDLKSKVDVIEARVGDIFTIINKMSDNLDKYVIKIEDNIERRDIRYNEIFKDLYNIKMDKDK